MTLQMGVGLSWDKQLKFPSHLVVFPKTKFSIRLVTILTPLNNQSYIIAAIGPVLAR